LITKCLAPRGRKRDIARNKINKWKSNSCRGRNYDHDRDVGDDSNPTHFDAWSRKSRGQSQLDEGIVLTAVGSADIGKCGVDG
jgi:hypothetical protein